MRSVKGRAHLAAGQTLGAAPLRWALVLTPRRPEVLLTPLVAQMTQMTQMAQMPLAWMLRALRSKVLKP